MQYVYKSLSATQNINPWISQIHTPVRYSRICNDIGAFSDRVFKITNDLVGLGFKRQRLRKIYFSVVRRHGLNEKFGTGCGNVLP